MRANEESDMSRFRGASTRASTRACGVENRLDAVPVRPCTPGVATSDRRSLKAPEGRDTRAHRSFHDLRSSAIESPLPEKLDLHGACQRLCPRHAAHAEAIDPITSPQESSNPFWALRRMTEKRRSIGVTAKMDGSPIPVGIPWV